MNTAPEVPPTETKNVETPEDKALATAITNKLASLAAQPLTPRVLLMMEQFARLGRELLCVGKDSKALNRKSPYGYNSYSMYDDVPADYPGEPLAPAPKAETFGAQLIREVVAMQNKAPQMTPTEMIGAIALAKEKGLDDIAVKLEEKLLNTQTAPEPTKETKALPVSNGHTHNHSHGVTP